MECRHTKHTILEYITTLAIGSLLACSASATEFRFSGFATAAGGKTLDQGTRYVVDPTTQSGYDSDLRFDPESLMGLQVQALVSPQLRGTLQLVAKGGDDYAAKADWAYITYDITPTLSVNAGRYRLPTFYYSESLDVGYSYYWIRPPVEVYRIFTANLDGVNFYHSHFFGDMEVITEAWYGSNETDFTISTASGDTEFNADTTRNLGINTTLGWDWLKLRLVYNMTNVIITTHLPPSLGLPEQVNESDITFMGAALMSDLGPFKWRSEYTHADNDSQDQASRSWYASAAYSLGQITPHYTHAVEKAREAPQDFDRTTRTLGVAWNFTAAAVLKLEYAKSEQKWATGSTRNLELVSTAVDIIF